MDFEISKAQFRDDQFYKDNGIDILKVSSASKNICGYYTQILQGVAATSVDTAANIVSLSNGSELTYDKLYIATGSNPRKPDVPGKELKNVCVLKDYDDSA